MSVFQYPAVSYLFAALFLPTQLAVAQLALPEGGEPGAGDAQVLERGPVHEAFAEPFAVDPADEGVDLLVVAQRPPEAVDELPPEVRPEGNNVQWIPGYWMWSVEREDFIWISGIWRNFPPGRQWVAGYWEVAGNGFRWVSGFWQQVDQAPPVFLPEPPESLEVGPNQPAPTVNHFWIPGCWTWQTTQYAWRPGYWYQGYDNWIWTPHRYVWTPRGYLFVRGYWDFPLARRGLLYAPVYWARPLVAWRHVRYTPRYVVNVNLLLGNLFVNPLQRHYYYGNYDLGYRQRYGLSPWFDIHPHRHGRGGRSYDPLLAYAHWQNDRHNPRWFDDMRSDFIDRHDHRNGDQGGRGRGPGGNGKVETARRGPSGLVRSVTEYVRDPATDVKVTRLTNPQVLEARQAARSRVAEKHLEGRQVVRGPHESTVQADVRNRGPNESSVQSNLRNGGRREATTRAKVTLPGDGQAAGAESPQVDPRTNNRQQLDARWQARQQMLREQAASDSAAARQRVDRSDQSSVRNDPRYQQYRQRFQQATPQEQVNPTQRFEFNRGNDPRYRQEAPTSRFRGQPSATQPAPQVRNYSLRRSESTPATTQGSSIQRRAIERGPARIQQVVPSQGSGARAGRGAPAARVNSAATPAGEIHAGSVSPALPHQQTPRPNHSEPLY